MGSVWLLLFLVPVLWILKFIHRRWRLHRLRAALGLRGPPTNNLVLGNIDELSKHREERTQYKKWAEWQKEYGPTWALFLGPQLIICTTDLAIIRDVFIKHFANFTDRISIAATANGPISRSLLQLQGSEWKNVRATLAPTFSNFKMKQMFGLIAEEVAVLRKKMSERAEAGVPFDIYDDFQALTLSVIGRCAFGVQTDAQRDPTHQFFVSSRSFVDNSDPTQDWVFRYSVILPELSPIFSRFRPLTEVGVADATLVNGLRAAVKRRMAENIEGKRPEPPDALQLMMEGGGLGAEDLLATALSFLLAGYETTSTALAYASHCLASEPAAQAKLRAEVIAAFADVPDASPETYDKLKSLPYLDAVLKETLRLYPPVIKFTTRTCVRETVVGEGLRVPVGACVDVNVYSLHRDPAHWTQPERFNPDRLSAQGWAEAERNLIWQPFGVGPRNCIGMRFAMVEFKLALATLVREFRMEPPSAGGEELRVGQLSILLRPVQGVRVKLSKL